MVGKEEEDLTILEVMNFMRNRNTEEFLAEDRSFRRLGMDKRLAV